MGMTNPRVRRLREKKLRDSVRRPVKRRVVVDKSRLYWVLGQLMAYERRYMSLRDLAREIGLSYRTIRHILNEDLPKGLPGGMPMVNKIIAAMRERGIVLHPSDFMEVLEPSPKSSQSE